MGALVLICFSLLVWRWAVLQVVRQDEYLARAENNRIAKRMVPPGRGIITDRNGIVLATNYSSHTLELTPSKVQDVDAAIESLRKILPISDSDIRRFKRLRQDSKAFDPLPLRYNLTDAEIALFTTQQHAFPGVEINARLLRQYPFGELAGHLVGYIGRISQKDQEALEESESAENYQGTTHIGKLGIEKTYEAQLHGTSGDEQLETTATGVIVRRLTSRAAVPGQNVVLSIDIRLQKMVEDLFGQRRGALVAIDPRDGQVLALVSKPTFDPNLFVDGIDQESWDALNQSINKPLLNRAVRGLYPPGSTYKPFMALAALETGARTPQTIISDPGYWMFGNHRFRSGHALGAVNLHRSIVKSSNVYYYSLAHQMGVQQIHDFMAPLGFGQITGIDIEGEVRGVLPSPAWKRNAFKQANQQQWLPGETVSLGIGQGYNSFTMLQLAHALATIVNGGTNQQPRIAMGLQDPTTLQITAPEREPAHAMGYQQQHIELIKSAMLGVTQEGTGRGVFAGTSYQSGGKTGTAQAVTIGQNQRYNASTLAEHKRDHSLYIAFAPVEKPEIALAVIVENAGFGATAAAPIARRVLDYWLIQQYPAPTDIAAASRGQAGRPSAPTIPVAELGWPPAGTQIHASVRQMRTAANTKIEAASSASVAGSAAANAASAPSSAASAAAYRPDTQVQRMRELFVPASGASAPAPAPTPTPVVSPASQQPPKP
ncbi:MAG: penicillin-binding protein 2 [Brachymonas sp.]|nr:penicillin-binding protein 2 [Brachymonas sp.]